MQLTTTSYAILGLLGLRPHTAYDLTQQARRSLAFVWQTSESQLYAEPKRLAALGLVEMTDEPAGPRRRRTVYAITETGRRALRDWIAARPAPPRWDSEMLLRALFADAGSLDDLRRAIAAHRQDVLVQHERGRALVAEQLTGAAPYPERASLNVLWWAYVAERLRLDLAWLAFVDDELTRWSSTDPRPFDDRARAIAEAIAAGRPVSFPAPAALRGEGRASAGTAEPPGSRGPAAGRHS